MALDDLNGIANVQFEAVETITWETAADWDGAVSEMGVVHEVATEADHGDDTTVRKGYSVTSPYKAADLEGFWPFHEDSGTTLRDASGNGRDGSLNSGNPGATGLLGNDALALDGSGDYGTVPDLDPFQDHPLTYVIWFKPNSTGVQQALLEKGAVSANPGGGLFVQGDDTLAYNAMNPSSNDGLFQQQCAGGTVDTSWQMALGTWSGSNSDDHRVYLNDTLVDQANQANSGTDPRTAVAVGTFGNNLGNSTFGGNLAEAMIFSAEFTGSEVQDLYDTVLGTSTLTTGTKTLSSAQPDLTGLTYSLNGQTIVLDVIGSPGTASEEIVSQTLDGATSYTLTWADSHTDFRVKLNLETSDPTVTPTVGSVSLVV